MRPILVKLQRQNRRPLLAFSLKAPPRRRDRGLDLRTLPGPCSSKTDELIDALVRNLQTSQSMIQAPLGADRVEPVPRMGGPSEE